MGMGRKDGSPQGPFLRASPSASSQSVPPVARSIHHELLGQMLVYQSEDFAEFKAARAEDRAPKYRIT